jgi:hypothetical protein
MNDPALEAHEHAEHAEEAAHERDPFISQVSITIALLAVIAAITGSLETVEDGSAIIAAQEAVLSQDQATDQWSYYQAKGVKAEEERKAAVTLSQSHEQRHHRLTLGATLLEMGIAISTIAIITRRRWPWYGSALLGVSGIGVALWAYEPLLMSMMAK